jgi:adenine/guanine phosphoribosyltransferase-like PRPP-binding protein
MTSLEWGVLGLRIEVSSDSGLGWNALAGLAVRRNPKRAHLIVSKVLGKHIPAYPADMRARARLLGSAVARETNGCGTLTIVGYAETATGLGHLLAAELPGSAYLHSTRDLRSGRRSILDFEEAHSHATAHHVLADEAFLSTTGPLVLVDDELTTGNTAMATIAAVHRVAPRELYVIATLLDMRSVGDQLAMARFADALGVQLEVISLLSATLTTPHDVAARAQAVLERSTGPLIPPAPTGLWEPPTPVRLWPGTVRASGRHGWTCEDDAAAGISARYVASALECQLRGEDVLVLGTEELMYAPMLIAEHLPGDVQFQSTTRSPVAVLDDDEYAIRSAVMFPAIDDAARPAYLYNANDKGRSDIVVVTSDPARTGGASAMLQALAYADPSAVIHHVELPYVMAAHRAAVRQ